MKDIRVCFVVNEYPGWGMRGGFGYVTKTIAEGLASTRKVKVFVLTTLHENEKNVKTIEYVNGVHVIHIPKPKIQKFKSKLLYQITDADIFHHEDINTDSFFVWKYNQSAPHIVTFQDPAPPEEVLRVEEAKKGRRLNLFERAFLELKYHLYRKMFIAPVIHHANYLFSQVKDIIPFVKKYYNIKRDIGFLPNPIRIPRKKIKKAGQPTVLYLGRLDAEKRPHLVVKLARKFPDVKFILAGAPSRDFGYASRVKKLAKKQHNIILPGWVTGKKKEELLEKSWILINTSIKERLPFSFLEGMAYRNALLAYVNPDNLVSRFGVRVSDGNFENGLKKLLEDDKWKIKGKEGQEYAKRNYEYEKIIKKHLKIYEKALKEKLI